jgi:hypothetical protein
MRKKLNQIKKYRVSASRHLRSSERYKKLSLLGLIASIGFACFGLWNYVLWISTSSVLLGVLGLISIELFYLNYELWKTNTKKLVKQVHDGGHVKKSGEGMESGENPERGDIGTLERTPSPLAGL